jgi:lipoprotein-anchoring transpeptidase ErfK/SrfK
MRQRSFIVLAVLVLVLVLGAVGVYAYDSSHKNTIANGVTAGGVDISGLKPKAAQAKLDRELAAPLRKTVVVKWNHHRYKLTPDQAQVRVNTADMVQQAVEASRKGGIISRATRELTGGSVHKSIPVQVTYSRHAVAKFAKALQKKIDTPAHDASISFSGGGIQKVDSQTGLKLDTRALRRRMGQELLQATADHKLSAPVTKVEPKVTTAQLAQKYPRVITINRSGFQLTLYHDLQPAKTYKIAVGRQGLETPAGSYNIQDKQVNPSWHVPNSPWAGALAGKVIPPGPQDPIKARWMGIAGGAGIHGTSDIGSLGSAASHGCIRMSIPDVEELFDRVQVGDPVFIS